MKRSWKIGLLILFIFAFSVPVLAAQWEPIYPEAPNVFLETDTVIKDNDGTIAFGEKEVFPSTTYKNRAYVINHFKYDPHTSMLKHYGQQYYDINNNLLEGYVHDLQTIPWVKIDPNDNVLKRVREIVDNSNGQTFNTRPNMQDNRFPANWNGLKLIKSGTMPSKLSLDMTLTTNAAIRGIIIKQPRTEISDVGTLSFYFNNGDYNYAGLTFFQDQIGFWFSWNGQEWFDRAIWKNGLYKSSFYNSSVAFYVPGDGYMYVDVIPLNPALQSKSYKFKLPEGAQYFSGICHENGLIGEIGLYQ